MSDSSLKFLREYWFILVFVGGLIVSWTSFQASISSLEQRVTKVEIQADSGAVAIASINTQLAEIKTSLEFIKQQLAH